MAIGETLLKVSDYPFAYSIGFVVISILGYDISNEKALPFLALAGFAGTFLAIVDPFGWGVRSYFMRFAKTDFKRKKDTKIVSEWNYTHSAFYTNSINLEKDRIVSILYFIMILFLFLYALIYDSFAKKLIIENAVIHCNLDCVRNYYSISIFITMIIVTIKLIWNGMQLSKKSDIVATYLFSVGSSDVPKESVDSISKFIELGDWTTAKYWQDKIRVDLQYRKGRKDNVLKAIDKIYRPLSKESIQITGTQNQVASEERYYQIITQTWDTIRNNSDFVLMDDTIKQDVVSLYDKIYEYNQGLGIIRKRIDEDIILKRASEEYEKKVRQKDSCSILCNMVSILCQFQTNFRVCQNSGI